MPHNDDDSVVSVLFDEDSRAYEALSTLKTLDEQKQINLRGAAVVVRDAAGFVEIKDQVGDTGSSGAATGGLIGLVVGIIGGPFGILLGGATGLLIGSLFDDGDSAETESVLADVSRSVHAGRTALLAEVEEQSPEVVDSAMESLHGVVTRRTVGDVEAEIAASEDAQRAAAKAAREQLREARREQHRDHIHAKIAELKAKLPGHKRASA